MKKSEYTEKYIWDEKDTVEKAPRAEDYSGIRSCAMIKTSGDVFYSHTHKKDPIVGP